MQYRYRALDPGGRTVRGKLAALDPADLAARLARLQLELIDGRACNRRSGAGRRPVRRRDLIGFCTCMAQLGQAGVPLLDGLADLRDSLEPGRLRDVLAELIDDLEGGLCLSQAMGRHPRQFAPAMLHLVQAGEASGRLPEVFADLAETFKWQDELAAQTRQLLLYPLFVALTVAGVTVFLLAWLVPRLAGFITGMQQALPWNTRLLLALSDIVVEHGHWLALGLAALPLAAWLWRRLDPHHARRRDRLLLRLPFVGPILARIALARFAHYFALLYGAGIPIIDGLALLEGVVGNRAIAAALGRARERIVDGGGIAASFAAAGLFPPLVVRMLRMGETTGALEQALGNVGYFYQREVRETIARVQVLIEPALTLALGLLLGSVMLSVLGPIYDLVGRIKP